MPSPPMIARAAVTLLLCAQAPLLTAAPIDDPEPTNWPTAVTETRSTDPEPAAWPTVDFSR